MSLPSIVSPGGGGSGGEQTQSDWSQSNNSAVDYIKNKPTLGSIASQNSQSANIVRVGSLGSVSLHDLKTGTFETPEYISTELSGSCVYNNNSEADSYCQLPPSDSGIELSFQVKNNGRGLYIIVDSSDNFNGDISGSGYTMISSNSPGSILTIRCIESGRWATSICGEWHAWVDESYTLFSGSYIYGNPQSMGLSNMSTQSSDNINVSGGVISDTTISNPSVFIKCKSISGHPNISPYLVPVLESGTTYFNSDLTANQYFVLPFDSPENSVPIGANYEIIVNVSSGHGVVVKTTSPAIMEFPSFTGNTSTSNSSGSSIRLIYIGNNTWNAKIMGVWTGF